MNNIVWNISVLIICCRITDNDTISRYYEISKKEKLWVIRDHPN